MSITVVSNEKPNQSVPAEKAELENGNSKQTKSASAHQDELDENLSEDSEAAENDSDVDSEGDENESQDESKNDKPKKKGGFQKRISKLTARASSAEAERDYWREQALKRNAQEQQAPKETSKNESKADGRPNPDDFDTNAEYIDALTDWKLEQREAKAKAESEKNQAKTEEQKRAETFQNKINEFKKEHADFEDVIDSCEVDLSKDLQSMILESDLAPQLMYDLANKPEEIERLNSLKGFQLAKALGVLEDRLSKNSESQKEKPKTSKAPAPITPVGGKSANTARKSIYDSDLSQAEYEALRREQMKAKQA